MTNLRELPSVDQVLRGVDNLGLPHGIVVQQIRNVLQERRSGTTSDSSIEHDVSARLRALVQPSLRHVINATGVILHTNLGRAPMPHFEVLSGYSNLEYDLATGKRGKRDAHTSHLLQALLNVPAIVVNNNAAAVFLVLNELAAGHEVIISRGELIEIGDGFRIPEIMTRSGVTLREVGTTNRTTLDDYRNAITPQTRLILRVHPSNFHISGFTARPELAELSTLGIPVYEDLGSGCLVDLSSYGINEPLVSASIQAGVSVVTFSCDKLLGGPQSGIIAGDKTLVERIRRNPLYRAFRADKLVIQALQTSLLHLIKQDWQKIPALRMITEPLESVQARAILLSQKIPGSRIRASEGAIGGGSTPDQTLPTYVVEIRTDNASKLERALRQNNPPVLSRIEKGSVLLDCRTIHDSEIELVSSAMIQLPSPVESVE
jgi:L-seryl-tRNA(Ser) seleniumtransferase